MRIGKLISWHKNQSLHSLNLEALQRKSNIPTHFFSFSGEKPVHPRKNVKWKSAFTYNISAELVPLKIAFN